MFGSCLNYCTDINFIKIKIMLAINERFIQVKGVTCYELASDTISVRIRMLASKKKASVIVVRQNVSSL